MVLYDDVHHQCILIDACSEGAVTSCSSETCLHVIETKVSYILCK